MTIRVYDTGVKRFAGDITRTPGTPFDLIRPEEAAAWIAAGWATSSPLVVSGDTPTNYIGFNSGSTFVLRHGRNGTADFFGTDVAGVLNQAIDAHADGNGCSFAFYPDSYVLTHPVRSDADYISFAGLGGHAESTRFILSASAGSLFSADPNTTYGTVVASFGIGSAGSGYPTPGTYLCTCTGGSPTTPATCNVTVNGSNVISNVALVSGGAGYVNTGPTPTVDLTPLGTPSGSAGSITVTMNGVPTGWTAGQSTAGVIFGNTRNVQGNILSGITIIGSTYNGTGLLAGQPIDGIWVRGSNNAVRDAHIKQCPQDGLRFDSWDYTGTSVFDNLTDNVYSIQNNRDGLYSGFRITDTEYRSTRIDGLLGSGTKVSRYGFYIQGGEIKLQFCHPYGCVQDGLHVDRGTGIDIIGGKYETNGRANIYVQMGGSNTYNHLSLVGVECYGSGPSANDLFVQKVNFLRIAASAFYSPCAKNINMVQVSKAVMGLCSIQNSAASAIGVYGDSSTNYVDLGTNEIFMGGTGGVAVDIAGGSWLLSNNALEGNVTVEATATQTRLSNNRITGTVSDSGSSTKWRGNLGYVSEASGSGTVAQNATSVTITHGLAATPTRVKVTMTSDAGTNHYITNKTSTQFTVNLHVANASGNVTFDWEATLADL